LLKQGGVVGSRQGRVLLILEQSDHGQSQSRLLMYPKCTLKLALYCRFPWWSAMVVGGATVHGAVYTQANGQRFSVLGACAWFQLGACVHVAYMLRVCAKFMFV
jgi:hypothetical protein